MIVGTVQNSVKQMQSQIEIQVGMDENLLMKKHYEEQLEKSKEAAKYNRIYNKIAGGQELTGEELALLKERDPKAYMDYEAEKLKREAYERELRNCRTKEEAERVHMNKMNGKLNELNGIVNNPNIPKSEKLKEAQRILGETTRSVKIFHTFVRSEEFQELPTDEELAEALKAKNEVVPEEQIPDKAHQKEPVTEEKPTKELLLEEAFTDKEQKEVICNETKILDAEKEILVKMSEIEEKKLGHKNEKRIIDITL